MYKIAVLGSGSFGVTLANLIKENETITRKRDVTLWSYDGKPMLKKLDNIILTLDKNEAVADKNFIIFAITTLHMPSFFNDLNYACIAKNVKIISASKGFVEDNNKIYLTSEYIITKMSSGLNIDFHNISAISGPNLAELVNEKYLTSTTIASNSKKMNFITYRLLNNDNFIVNQSHDIISLQLFGALKNAYSFITGYVSSKYGKNAEAAVFSLSCEEMKQCVAKLYSYFNKTKIKKIPDFSNMYLAAIGDFYVTCQGGRNHELGQIIGNGIKIDSALNNYKRGRPEGIDTIRKVYSLILENKISAPLLEEAYKVFFEDKNPEFALKDLVKKKMIF